MMEESANNSDGEATTTSTIDFQKLTISSVWDSSWSILFWPIILVLLIVLQTSIPFLVKLVRKLFTNYILYTMYCTYVLKFAAKIQVVKLWYIYVALF